MKAIGSAFQTQGFTYFSGAENQGTKKLEHYQPTNNEVREYWSNLLSIIKKEILSRTIFFDQCCSILSNSLRGFVRSRAFDIILPIIDEIILFRNNDWDEIVDSLYSVIEYDSIYLDEHSKNTVSKYIEILRKEDFVSKFLEVKKNRQRGNKSVPFKESIVIQQKMYSELAKEFVENEYYTKEILTTLFAQKDSFSTPFGSTVAELLNKDFDKNVIFIDKSIHVLSKRSEFNPSIIIDYSKTLNDQVFDYLKESLMDNPSLTHLLFPILGARRTGYDNMSILFRLVDETPSLIDNFITFFNYNIITPEDDAKIADALKNIRAYGLKAYKQ